MRAFACLPFFGSGRNVPKKAAKKYVFFQQNGKNLLQKRQK